MVAVGMALRCPRAPNASSSAAMPEHVPMQQVETSVLTNPMVSAMASAAVTEPPGELR